MNQLETDIVYEDCDGEPIAENTEQLRWIIMLMINLDHFFRDRPDVFVAGDNLIYPVEGDNKTRRAPDVYVAFGRPKGRRGSYQVWKEGNIFPQVVFEVLSPGNRGEELQRKLEWYERYGAQEYYIYDPDDYRLQVYLRRGVELVEHEVGARFTSPLLGITFVPGDGDLRVYGPDGSEFLDHQESMLRSSRTTAAEEIAELERQRADEEAQRAERLAAKLRALGIDPDQP